MLDLVGARPAADVVRDAGALVRAAGATLSRPSCPLDALLGALHAAEHSQIAVLPLLAMCDRWDIGGLSTNLHPQTGGPTIFIYDGHPGGIGITRRGFLAFDALVDDAHRLISECPCERGCPSCVQSPKCGNLNEPLSKAGARELMGRMLAVRAVLARARSRAASGAVRHAADTVRCMRRLLVPGVRGRCSLLAGRSGRRAAPDPQTGGAAAPDRAAATLRAADRASRALKRRRRPAGGARVHRLPGARRARERAATFA